MEDGDKRELVHVIRTALASRHLSLLFLSYSWLASRSKDTFRAMGKHLRIDIIKAEDQSQELKEGLPSSPSTPDIHESLAAVSLTRSRTLPRLTSSANEIVQPTASLPSLTEQAQGSLNRWILGVAIGEIEGVKSLHPSNSSLISFSS